MKAATPQYWHGAGVTAISIHAAREGGDREIHSAAIFQHISIHAAREGGDFISTRIFIAVSISIHAAREGGDLIGIGSCLRREYFNPRRP